MVQARDLRRFNANMYDNHGDERIIRCMDYLITTFESDFPSDKPISTVMLAEGDGLNFNHNFSMPHDGLEHLMRVYGEKYAKTGYTILGIGYAESFADNNDMVAITPEGLRIVGVYCVYAWDDTFNLMGSKFMMAFSPDMEFSLFPSEEVTYRDDCLVDDFMVTYAQYTGIRNNKESYIKNFQKTQLFQKLYGNMYN